MSHSPIRDAAACQHAQRPYFRHCGTGQKSQNDEPARVLHCNEAGSFLQDAHAISVSQGRRGLWAEAWRNVRTYGAREGAARRRALSVSNVREDRGRQWMCVRGPNTGLLRDRTRRHSLGMPPSPAVV